MTLLKKNLRNVVISYLESETENNIDLAGSILKKFWK